MPFNVISFDAKRPVDTRLGLRYYAHTFCTGFRKPVKFGRGRAAVIGYKLSISHFPQGREGESKVKP